MHVILKDFYWRSDIMLPEYLVIFVIEFMFVQLLIYSLLAIQGFHMALMIKVWEKHLLVMVKLSKASDNLLAYLYLIFSSCIWAHRLYLVQLGWSWTGKLEGLEGLDLWLLHPTKKPLLPLVALMGRYILSTIHFAYEFK